MAEATAPFRPVDRQSETDSETDEPVLGQEELDALLLASIPLPDGRLIAVEALVAAIAAGDATVPVAEGEAVPVVLLLDMLQKAFAKAGVEGNVDPSEEDGQGSFREGMNLIMLGSLLENGRIVAAEEVSRPQEIGQRSKEKTVDKGDQLRDILVDGPVAGDDIIRPPGIRPIDGEFIERARVDDGKGVFETTQSTGFLQTNDLPGSNGFGSIMSIEYNKAVYTPDGGQIVIDEPGIWRLTISLAGVPGEPETGYGMYYFEQYGPYHHSKVPDGEIARFSLIYKVDDAAGKQDTATISFAIVDSNPQAMDDTAVTVQGHIVDGFVSENDDMGGDFPGGVVSIGFGDKIVLEKHAAADGTVTLEGAHGTLVFDFDDGYFEYYARAAALGGNEEAVADEFFYTIADSDGDEDSAILRVSIVPGDSLPDEPDISNPGGEDDDTPRTTGLIFTWSEVSDIDDNLDGQVDGVQSIKGFDPSIDRLDIDGLLSDLGYEGIETAGDVFRMIGAVGSIELQIDLGAGWQTFANVSNSLPLTFEQVEAAIVA